MRQLRPAHPTTRPNREVTTMATRTKLSPDEITAALVDLPGWEVQDGKLHREYAFENFVHAFAFLSAGAVSAEAMNHHPEWFNVYGRVTIDLITHDAGGITRNDLELAGRFEAIAAKLLD